LKLPPPALCGITGTAVYVISDAKADLAAMPVNMEGKGTHPKGAQKAKFQRNLSESGTSVHRPCSGNLWVPKAASAQVHHGSSRSIAFKIRIVR